MSLIGEVSKSIRIIDNLQLLIGIRYLYIFYIGSYIYLLCSRKKVPSYLVFFAI
jgi:hypothetical protein